MGNIHLESQARMDDERNMSYVIYHETKGIYQDAKISQIEELLRYHIT